MLKPTANKDRCWHSVSQSYTATAAERVRRRELTTPATALASSSDDDHYHLAAPVPPTDCDLGDASYYARLSQLIDKHLALATHDRVCYVGDDRDAGAHLLTSLVAEHYCLVTPVTRVNPLHHV